MMLKITLLVLVFIHVCGVLSEENVLSARENRSERKFINDPEFLSLRRKFGLLFEPDERRGESRTAFRHILSYLSRRPGYIKPSVPADSESVCAQDGGSDTGNPVPASWSAGQTGYYARSPLPAIIGSMRDDEVPSYGM